MFFTYDELRVHVHIITALTQSMEGERKKGNFLERLLTRTPHLVRV